MERSRNVVGQHRVSNKKHVRMSRASHKHVHVLENNPSTPATHKSYRCTTLTSQGKEEKRRTLEKHTSGTAVFPQHIRS
eukprot:g68796.t1